MLTEKLARMRVGLAPLRTPDELTTLTVEPIHGQMTVDEVIESLRCVDCDAKIEGDRADCAALRCHDCA